MADGEKQDIIATGLAAQALLASPTLLAALEMARQEVLEEWQAAGTTTERERLHGAYCVLPAVVKQLRILRDRGEHELGQSK